MFTLVRVLEKLAERVHRGQMDGQADQQVSHPAVHLRPATIQRDCGNKAVIQGSKCPPPPNKSLGIGI
jgi:hypothetical protein